MYAPGIVRTLHNKWENFPWEIKVPDLLTTLPQVTKTTNIRKYPFCSTSLCYIPLFSVCWNIDDSLVGQLINHHSDDNDDGFNLTRSESGHGRVYFMMRLFSKGVEDDDSKSSWSEEKLKWWWQWQEWFWGVMGRLEGRVPRHQTALLSQPSCKQFKFKSQKHDYDKDGDDT